MRPGHSLALTPLYDPDDDSLRGCVNVHIPIEFDDGVKWLARARQTGYHASPRHISRLSMQGEICTLRWLENISAPAPRAISDINGECISTFQLKPQQPKVRRTITYLSASLENPARCPSSISGYLFLRIYPVLSLTSPCSSSASPNTLFERSAHYSQVHPQRRGQWDLF